MFSIEIIKGMCYDVLRSATVDYLISHLKLQSCDWPWKVIQRHSTPLVIKKYSNTRRRTSFELDVFTNLNKIDIYPTDVTFIEDEGEKYVVRKNLGKFSTNHLNFLTHFRFIWCAGSKTLDDPIEIGCKRIYIMRF